MQLERVSRWNPFFDDSLPALAISDHGAGYAMLILYRFIKPRTEPQRHRGKPVEVADVNNVLNLRTVHIFDANLVADDLLAAFQLKAVPFGQTQDGARLNRHGKTFFFGHCHLARMIDGASNLDIA
jgi:hypothetical protein